MLNSHIPWRDAVGLIIGLVTFSFAISYRLVYRRSLNEGPRSRLLALNAFVALTLANFIWAIADYLYYLLAIKMAVWTGLFAASLLCLGIGMYFLYRLVRYQPM